MPASACERSTNAPSPVRARRSSAVSAATAAVAPETASVMASEVTRGSLCE